MEKDIFSFFGRIVLKRLAAKSKQRFEACVFLEVTDRGVPREPEHFLPPEIHHQVPTLKKKFSTFDDGVPTASDELQIITLPKSDPPPDVTNEHLDFLKGKDKSHF